jgi:hypothetical protein
MTVFLLGLVIATAASLWVVQPILARRAALLAEAAPGAVQDADARARVAVAAVKELEYEYIAGNLDAEDYRMLKRRLSAEAVQALRRADEVRGDAPAEQAARCCGFDNPPGSRFCGGCGARIS